MRRSRRNERLTEPSSGTAAAAKNAEARGFRPGNRDLLDLLGKGSAAPEMAELEEAAEALPGAPSSADPGGGAAMHAPVAPPDIPLTGARSEAVTGALGSPQSVPAKIRGPMEQLLGRDLSGVDVFQGGGAAALAARQGAEAFTLGEQIVMGGDFLPGTLFGDALLAHELAHVAHQSEGGPASSAPEPQLENEADLSAAALVAKLLGAGQGARQLMPDAAPRARSGIRVQRCSKCNSCGKKKETEESVKKTVEDGASCPAGVESKQAGAVAETLKTKFGFSKVTAAEGSCWTAAELGKMEKAFGRMSSDQLTALKGVELRRVETADCAGHQADGCFTSAMEASKGRRTDRLEMGDAAFAKDKDFDEGGAYILGPKGEKLDLKPSEETALHEAGHAVETAEVRAAEPPRVIADNAASKAQTELNAAVTAFNAAFPPAGSFPFTPVSAEKAYVSAMIAWVKALQKVTDPTDKLSATTAPAQKDFDDAVTALEKRVKTAKKAQSTATAKAGKLASGSAIRDTALESGLATTNAAADNLLAKLIARRDAEQTLNKAKSAERAVSASIRLGDADKPSGMSRRLADFVALLHVRGVDPKAHAGLAPYGTDNWPDRPGELFADYYELSRTRPESLKKLDTEVAKFFDDPIGVKDKKVKKQVDAWIKARS